MHGVPCSRNWFAGRRLESVYSWFYDLGDFVWSFPGLFSVFEHFTEYDVAQLERSRPDLLIVVVLDLVLIILDVVQSLVASFFNSVQGVEQHVAVKLDVLWHF